LRADILCFGGSRHGDIKPQAWQIGLFGRDEAGGRCGKHNRAVKWTRGTTQNFLHRGECSTNFTENTRPDDDARCGEFTVLTTHEVGKEGSGQGRKKKKEELRNNRLQVPLAGFALIYPILDDGVIEQACASCLTVFADIWRIALFETHSSG
jgi:hypothetical protein